MIIKNTATGARFASKARKIIDAEPGFRATIDKTWNCGEDIRIEIGTVGAPFIVITDLKEELDVKIRMTKTDLDATEVLELKDRMEGLDRIIRRMNELR